MSDYKFKNLSPFKFFILETFPFIQQEYFDAMNEWQLFCKVGEKINEIINSQNSVGEETEALYNAYIQLKDYIDNYFENLDVQYEINTKLDEMAVSGELAAVIAQYLESQAIIGFNNLSDLANAKNLANGSFARTYGKLTYNDGKGSFYKIRTRINADVPDGDNIVVLVNTENLVAEKMPDDKLTYYYVKTTDSFEKIQNYFNDEKSKIISFEKGEYTFNQAFRLNANTKILLNNSNLIFNIPKVSEDWENSHGFYNFKRDDEFLEYNGNGNIEVIGGTITHGNFSFCHAKNIAFKNLLFNLCNNDHVLEMCGINGLLVENCVFNGQALTDSNFKECIQLDTTDRNSFPFFDDENNPTYDNTANKNWSIRNNKFLNPNVEGYTFTCGIGNHGYITGVYHENIDIINNEFNNSTNLSIQLYNTKNVNIINNKFYCDNSNAINNQGCHLRTRNSFENLLIENNIFEGNLRAIENAEPKIAGNNKNLRIINNLFKNYINYLENISFIKLYDIDKCYIKNNIFDEFIITCIRTYYAITNSNNEYYIENNTFKTSRTLLEDSSPIKAYDGKFYINKNIFDISNMSCSCITLSADSNVVYASDNKFNNYIITNDRTILFSTYDNSRKNIENKKRVWNGDSSSLTNQSLSNGFNFSDYKKMILTIGYGGETHTIILTSWDYVGQPYLDARTYRIYFGTGYVELKINSDGTFNYSQSGINLHLRNIVLINEN